MSPVDEILAQIPMSQLAGRLGVDVATAEQAARQAVPALLGGIQANTADPGGASSFAQAVQQHDGGLIRGGAGKDLMAALLPILAPIVMSWLASQLTGGAAAPAPQAAPQGGGGIGDVLGGILGGVLGGGALGGGAAPQQQSGPNLGDLLGGLLGGGRR